MVLVIRESHLPSMTMVCGGALRECLTLFFEPVVNTCATNGIGTLCDYPALESRMQ